MKDENYVKPKVLIADDEESHRTCLTILLEEEGWDVHQAKNGKEVIDQVFKEQPDLLILDYQMPDITGGEVYQYLQLNGIKLAVVLVSSEKDLEKLATCLGIAYYLHKPFDIPDLLTMINSAYKSYISQNLLIDNQTLT